MTGNLKSSGAAFASNALHDLQNRTAGSQMEIADQPTDIRAYESLQSSMLGNKDLVYNPPMLTGSLSIPRLGMKLSDAALNCYGGCTSQQDKYYKLMLSTSDNVNFNLYFTEYTDLDHPKFQNRFCKLLRTLSQNAQLHIHMGNGIYGYYPIFSYGNVIDAIQRTQSKIVAHVNGRAGFCETSLWLFAHERVISEFGSLYFTGMQQYLEWYPRWHFFYEFIFNRAVDLKILTQEEMDQLMTTNMDIYLSRAEVVARMQRENKPDPVEQDQTPPELTPADLDRAQPMADPQE